MVWHGKTKLAPRRRPNRPFQGRAPCSLRFHPVRFIEFHALAQCGCLPGWCADDKPDEAESGPRDFHQHDLFDRGRPGRGERPAGGPQPQTSGSGWWLFGPSLNRVAGAGDVLSEAVGCIAANAYDGQKNGDEEQQNEPLNQDDLMSFHGVIIELNQESVRALSSVHPIRNFGVDWLLL